MRLVTLAIAAITTGLAGTVLAACARPLPQVPRAPEAPAPLLVVSLPHFALRTAAWSELHAWLATEARSPDDEELADPILEEAVRAYHAALADDVRDERFAAGARALAGCADLRCAASSLEGTPFAAPFASALPVFLARGWTDRATRARDAVERARAAYGAEAEALHDRLVRDLGAEPGAAGAAGTPGGARAAGAQPTVTVDVVAEAPPPGREALVRAPLARQSACFVAVPKETDRMHDARIVDCLLGHVALALAPRSEIHAALVSALGAPRGQRAYGLVAIHAVAAVVTAWEPKHASVLRRSAAAVEPAAMEWLAKEWPSRMRGEAPAAFAARFAAR